MEGERRKGQRANTLKYLIGSCVSKQRLSSGTLFSTVFLTFIEFQAISESQPKIVNEVLMALASKYKKQG